MLDITKDYEIFDNKEVITIQNQGSTPIVIPDVIRRAATIGTDSMGGSIIYSTAIEFLIWKDNAPVNFVPRLNAKITDELGRIYTVDIVDDGVLRSRWSVKATSLASQGIN